jgi:hypothetical protein
MLANLRLLSPIEGLIWELLPGPCFNADLLVSIAELKVHVLLGDHFVLYNRNVLHHGC